MSMPWSCGTIAGCAAAKPVKTSKLIRECRNGMTGWLRGLDPSPPAPLPGAGRGEKDEAFIMSTSRSPPRFREGLGEGFFAKGLIFVSVMHQLHEFHFNSLTKIFANSIGSPWCCKAI